MNRLATAVSATGGNTNWGLGFSYDVYGNRTAQTVTAGSAPAFSATFGSNNRMFGYSYDANGNQLNAADGATLEYDEENRLKKWTKQGQSEEYRYHPSGWRLTSNDGSYLYGPGGQLLTKSAARYTDHVYFAGRLLFTMGEGSFDPRLTKLTRMYSDRLGSTRATTVLTYGGGTTPRNYYPFGEEIGGPLQGDASQYKFASTYRDSATGLDYAVNRYYASGVGRFLSADDSMMNERLKAPSSWNRDLYVDGDPINFTDPTGEGFWSSLWNGIKAIGSGIGSAFLEAGEGGGSDSMAMAEVSSDEGEGGGGTTPYVTSTVTYPVCSSNAAAVATCWSNCVQAGVGNAVGGAGNALVAITSTGATYAIGSAPMTILGVTVPIGQGSGIVAGASTGAVVGGALGSATTGAASGAATGAAAGSVAGTGAVAAAGVIAAAGSGWTIGTAAYCAGQCSANSCFQYP